MSLTGSTNAEKIWNYLYARIGNAYGVAGLMGNLYAESGLNPQNLQNSYEKSLGYSDSTYTAAVDNGTYTRFASDSAGYGLAQWTYSARKKNMLAYHQAAGASIGDLETQLGFLMQELQGGYSAVLNILKSASTVLEASNAVLTKFEKPADQSANVQTVRARYGQKYFDQYASESVSGSTPTYTVGKVYTTQVDALRVRTGAGTSYSQVSYTNLTANAKANAYENGALKKGAKVTCKATSSDSAGNIWMQIPSGWIAAYYDSKEYVA